MANCARRLDFLLSMKIIDDFLSDDEYQNLFSFITNNNFPWTYGKIVTDGYELIDTEYYQFTHSFYQFDLPTTYFQQVEFFREKLEMASLVRIKANLNPRTETLQIHDDAWHNDFDNMTTAIYYLNTNNGFTKFKNGDKVNSVANRIVIFDSNLKHTGTSCTDTHARLLINFNYFSK